MFSLDDTIFALATGTGNSALSIIRLSGKNTYSIAEKFIQLKKKRFLK